MLAISVENVSKRYRLGALDRNVLWRELAGKLGLGNRSRAAAREAAQEFWALQNVSFAIKPGETVGIVGANGAGKSTLLKILSRITSPTSGSVKINGRVGSLLEVGTGFNPEMTGRENTYLNGAIQGMKRPEIDAKFDDIVSFAGVEKFIDTPVKRYSSGMYVRLAFSVAAFLEAEIIIVDEVLSVGDQQFQNRCIQRLQEIIAQGRTVLFVSHGAGQVKKLCSRVICLKDGKVVCDDEPFIAMSAYQQSLSSSLSEETKSAEDPSLGMIQTPGKITFNGNLCPDDGIVRINFCEVRDSNGNFITSAASNTAFRFQFQFDVLQPNQFLRPAAYVSDELGNILFWTCDTNPLLYTEALKPGSYTASFEIPPDLLMPGTITLSGGVGEANEKGTSRALATDALRVNILDDLSPTSVRGSYSGPVPGFLRPRLNWETKCLHG